MEMIYQINPELDIPIYRQLVDVIRAAVKKGILLPDQTFHKRFNALAKSRIQRYPQADRLPLHGGNACLQTC